MITSVSPSASVAAVYLRCHPADFWHMHSLREALWHFARDLGFVDTEPFTDNGYASHAYLPGLHHLFQLVKQRHFTTVLVPGWWVFSIRDGDARTTGNALQNLGCRVVELPGRRPRHVPGDGWAESHRPARTPVPVPLPAPDHHRRPATHHRGQSCLRRPR
ncbi:hypothetical protein FBY35_3866 [Streptomyces sp. SLBN-118]|uniref:hypothetical protein n=1 Tax=Streptomyces sp. SLBN-118 TaxID=2768454 RepID=UPI001166D616|nr:hypothetical protein [Streptomyces sp. SLBN-118]TQK42458.1 hypothetical protein FBY35_3866 [Streptomyces sp. SLBN-118]